MTELKLMKAPTEQAILEDLKYPLACSYKLDGVRCLVKQGKVHSSTMRELRNKNLKKLLEPLLKLDDFVFDGELYAHDLTFQEIVSICMSYNARIPINFRLHVFDCLELNEWEKQKPEEKYKDRYDRCRDFSKLCGISVIEQENVESFDEVKYYINLASSRGYEGVMLRDWDAPYKHGRATYKQGLIYKYKFWQDFDAKIIDVKEMIGYKDDILREFDVTGYLKSTYKKENYEPKGTFGSFIVEVDIPESPKMEIGGWKGLTDNLRDDIWINKKDYIGKWIRFQGMKVGNKNLPRIPKNIEFRDPK
jgi:DNA ligase-1